LRKVEQVAEQAEQKPRAQRTADEYRALINQAAVQEDWPTMLRRAQAMDYVFERGDPLDAGWALQALGVAQDAQRPSGDGRADLQRPDHALFRRSVDGDPLRSAGRASQPRRRDRTNGP
jgi:hypothetical protein